MNKRSLRGRRRTGWVSGWVGMLAGVLVLVGLRPPAALADDPGPGSPGAGETVAWQERFDHDALGWIDPFQHATAKLAQVYSVGHEGPVSFLHARYDGTSALRPPALDYGKAFQDHPIALEKVRALRWRWRAVRHPAVGNDPWVDCAASVYVVIKVPTVVAGGRGFKFAWLAKPGPTGTHQHGLLQVPLTHDPAGTAWRTESVDLCALYRREFGACEGQHVLYVGVVTDGDGTQSVAEGDYADFQLVTSP